MLQPPKGHQADFPQQEVVNQVITLHVNNILKSIIKWQQITHISTEYPLVTLNQQNLQCSSLDIDMISHNIAQNIYF